jgi:hypothetical protein
MLPAYCTDINEYREWVKGPPGIYDDQPRYEKSQVVQFVDQDEIKEWIREFDEKEFPNETATSIASERTLKERFFEQSDKWDSETAHLSSPAQRFLHPSYVAIMGMAQENRDEIVRLLLQDMQANRREWFWALSYLTHENPIDLQDSGNLNKMIRAWGQWGRKKGLL